MSRLRGLLSVAAAVAGTVGFAVVSHAGLRAGLSFLGGLVLAWVLLSGGVVAVRWAGNAVPALSIVVALMTYTTTVVLFGAVLAAASPRVLYAWGFAVGLVVAVVLGASEQWQVNRARQTTLRGQ